MHVTQPRESSERAHEFVGLSDLLLPTQKTPLMVSRLHCGAHLALILAQITQLVPGLPPFEGKTNFVTEPSIFIFL